MTLKTYMGKWQNIFHAGHLSWAEEEKSVASTETVIDFETPI